MDDLWELARTGSLPPIIRIDKVACGEHGNLLPEMFSVPFSISSEVLVGLPIACGRCKREHGEEHAFLSPPTVEWRESEQLTEHVVAIGYDPDARPQYYPVWQVRPVGRVRDADGTVSNLYRTGSYKQPNDPE